MNEKQWVLYILQCADDSFYTGITDNLTRRLSAHGTSKGAKYTRGRGPFQLRYVEQCKDYSSALRREYQVKKLSRHQKSELCKKYTAREEE